MSDTLLLTGRVLLSRKEFSSLTGLSLRTTAKLLASCELHSIRVGRRRLILRTELERFTKRDHPTQPDERLGGSGASLKPRNKNTRRPSPQANAERRKKSSAADLGRH